MNTPSPTPKKTPDIGASAESKKDAVELLKADHRKVDQLFGQFKSAEGRQKRREVLEQIAAALIVHTMIEEEIFYPACREKGVEEDDLDEAQVEHDTVKLLVRDLLDGSVEDEYCDAKVTVLSEYVKHHVGEEENPSDGIFARAKSAGVDMEGLGTKLQARKDELTADERRLRARPLKIRSLNIPQNQEYSDMARYPSDRYRDEESRYGGYRTGSGQHGGDYDRNPDRGSRGYEDYRAGPGGYGAYPDMRGQPRRGIEQSGSGGRYRTYYDDGHNEAQRSGSERGYRFRDENENDRYDDYGRGGRYGGEQDFRGDREHQAGGRHGSPGGEYRGGYDNSRGEYGRDDHGHDYGGGYGNGSHGNNRGYPYGSR